MPQKLISQEALPSNSPDTTPLTLLTMIRQLWQGCSITSSQETSKIYYWRSYTKALDFILELVCTESIIILTLSSTTNGSHKQLANLPLPSPWSENHTQLTSKRTESELLLKWRLKMPQVLTGSVETELFLHCLSSHSIFFINEESTEVPNNLSL